MGRVGSYLLHLYCIGCNEFGEFSTQTLAQSLKSAKDAGWCVKEKEELCPHCNQFRKQQKRSISAHKAATARLLKTV